MAEVKRSNKRSRRAWRLLYKAALIIAIALAVSLSVWKGFCFARKLSLRRSVLPSGVTEFRDYLIIGYSVDVYCLKARMSFDEFQEYWISREYVTATASMVDTPFAVIPHLPAWWDPETDGGPVYCTPGSVPKSWRAIKYEDGYLYLLDWNEYLW